MAGDENWKVKDFGRGNMVRSKGQDPDAVPVEFTARATGCVVTLGAGSQMQGGKIRMRGPNGRVTFGERVTLSTNWLFVGDNSSIEIGTRVWAGPGTEMSAAEGASVRIGGETLIGANAIIRADDSHPFYDRTTGRRLNRGETVVLEEHVWLGRDVAVLPGAVVGTGSVVGTRGTVTKSRPVPANSVAVGNPAKVVRSNIEWLYKHVQLDSDVPESIKPIDVPDVQAAIVAGPSRLTLLRRRLVTIRRSAIGHVQRPEDPAAPPPSG